MTKQVMTLTKWQGKAIAKAVAVALAVIIGLDLLFGLIALVGGASVGSWTSMLTSFLGTLSGILGFITFFWALCFPYQTFKSGMAVGATRKSIWAANALLLVVLVVLIWLVDLLKDLALYASKGLSNFADGAGISLVTALAGLATVAAIGAGFALLSRRGKLLVGVGLPTVLIFLGIVALRVLVAVVDKDPNRFNNHALLSLSGAAGTALLWAGLIGWFLLMTGLSYWFFTRMQLRRD